MNDTQILTLAISVVIPISLLIYSNSRVSDISKRIDDAKGELNRRIDESNQRMDALKKEMVEHIDNGFEHMALLLKIHEAEHHKNS